MRKTSIRVAWLFLLLVGFEVQAFYNPSTGRWLSRDPVGDIALTRGAFSPTSDSTGLFGVKWVDLASKELGRSPFDFTANQPIDRTDSVGLFEDGHGGRAAPTEFRGHSDFHGHTCFDYTLEDHDPATRPFPGGNPAGHFQDRATSEAQVLAAVRECSPTAFERAMHRLQDFWTHYNKGYRWNPPRQLGHALDGPAPDRDNAAWAEAEAVTRQWVARWNMRCHCQPCWE